MTAPQELEPIPTHLGNSQLADTLQEILDGDNDIVAAMGELLFKGETDELGEEKVMVVVRPHETRFYDFGKTLPESFEPPCYEVEVMYTDIDLNRRIHGPLGFVSPVVKGADGNLYEFSESVFVDHAGHGVKVVTASPFDYAKTVEEGVLALHFTPDELEVRPFTPDVIKDYVASLNDIDRAGIKRHINGILDPEGSYFLP